MQCVRVDNHPGPAYVPIWCIHSDKVRECIDWWTNSNSKELKVLLHMPPLSPSQSRPLSNLHWRTFYPNLSVKWFVTIDTFEFFTNYTNMPILAFSSLQHKTKNPVTKCYPSGNRTQAASKSKTILSTLTWHVLLRRSLNICSCTTWYLNLDGFKENQ